MPTQIEVSVEKYIDECFKDVKSLVNHEELYAKTNRLVKTPVNYFRLRRFLFTALQNFYNLDTKYATPILRKLSANVRHLIDFYMQFTRQTRNVELAYQNMFLVLIPEYRALEEEKKLLILEKDKLDTEMTFYESMYKNLEAKSNLDDEERQIYRVNKQLYAEATHEYGTTKMRLQEVSDAIYKFNQMNKPVFTHKFLEMRGRYLKRLLVCINVKSYYLDKMIWDIAQYNRRVVEFLRSSNISGFYDTKTFLRYYLRTLDIKNTNDQDWHNCLVESLSLLE